MDFYYLSHTVCSSFSPNKHCENQTLALRSCFPIIYLLMETSLQSANCSCPEFKQHVLSPTARSQSGDPAKWISQTKTPPEGSECLLTAWTGSPTSGILELKWGGRLEQRVMFCNLHQNIGVPDAGRCQKAKEQIRRWQDLQVQAQVDFFLKNLLCTWIVGQNVSHSWFTQVFVKGNIISSVPSLQRPTFGAFFNHTP